MVVREALKNTMRCLRHGGVEDAALEAELLVGEALGVTRAELYCRLGDELEGGRRSALAGLTGRRLQGEPVSYITNRREFYGLDFYVDRRVLIPRPETELLVERAIALAGRPERGVPISIADIGTGSGAVAVALAVHLPPVGVYAVDVSAEALQVAVMNAERNGVSQRIVFLRGDLLEPLPVPVDIIVANLPYLTDSEACDPGLAYEPQVALRGGVEHISRLLRQCQAKLQPGGHVLLEMGKGQEGDVVSAAQRHVPGAACELFADLSGILRVIQIII